MSDVVIRDRTRTWIVRSLLACLMLSLAACKDEKGALEVIYKQTPAGRQAAVNDLTKAFFAEEITANGAINLAHERLENAGDASSAQFGLAVLEFLRVVEPDIQSKVINDFFWMRVGTLAGTTAAVARKLDDLETAREAVMAGPRGWQTEHYWQQHPSHDALASILLFESGKGDEALRRLHERADMNDEVQQAKAMIEREMRSGRKRP